MKITQCNKLIGSVIYDSVRTPRLLVPSSLMRSNTTSFGFKMIVFPFSKPDL